MSAVVDRVACPECGAQKGETCRPRLIWLGLHLTATVRNPHDARWEALWALNRRAAVNVNDRSTP